MVNGSQIDTFLLSCRILGKGIEKTFVKQILLELRNQGLTELKATYLPTAKNSQVADFYDKCGFAGTVIPDHTPRLDAADFWETGMAFALGYMRGLMNAER